MVVLHGVLARLVEAIAAVAGVFLGGYPGPLHCFEEAALNGYFEQDFPLEMELEVSVLNTDIIPWPVVPLVCATKGM